MDGLSRTGQTAEVVGLASHRLSWIAETMDPFTTRLPWLELSRATMQDARDAVQVGVFDNASNRLIGGSGTTRNWYLEFKLDQALTAFADGDDLVVMVYPRVFYILRTIARVVERHGWKLVVISTEALTDAQIDPSTRDLYVRCVAECSNGVWTLSEHLSEFWQSRGVPASRILVRPPAVREAAFETQGTPLPHSVTYLGNLEHREIDYLLDISAIVKRRIPEYHLTIYGDTTNERRRAVDEAIRSRNLSETISLMAAVSPAEVPDILAQSEILVLPRSKGEFSTAGFPNKLGEYLASGRPVVVTRVGDIPKYLQDRVSAFFVEPDDCEAFANAVVEALENRGLAESIGARGRQVAQELLASSSLASRLVSFLHNLPETKVRILPTPRPARALRVAAAVWMIPLVNVRTLAIALRYKLGLTRSGQYGWMSAKILIVKVLRFLHLWPQVPKP
jgi:glycosyltransferase involved in cell wall biosynthesis